MAEILAFLTSIMTPYEWFRVILHLAQVVVMVVVPFVVLKKRFKLEWSNPSDDEDKK